MSNYTIVPNYGMMEAPTYETIDEAIKAAEDLINSEYEATPKEVLIVNVEKKAVTVTTSAIEDIE